MLFPILCCARPCGYIVLWGAAARGRSLRKRLQVPTSAGTAIAPWISHSTLRDLESIVVASAWSAALMELNARRKRTAPERFL